MSAPGTSFGTQPPSVPTERSALNKIMWFGIIQLVGLVAGWVLYFYVFNNLIFTSASLNLPPNPTPQQVSSALGPLFQNLTLFIPISIGIELVAIIVLILGMREFGHVDRSSFSVPSKLVYLLAIGYLIVAAAAIPLFNSIPNIIAQAPPANATPPSAFFSAISSLLFFALIVFVGGILALIGLIGGQILGLWRVGSRYNETLLKLGAIFVIIPLLNIVAPILVLIGAYSAKGRLGTA